MSERPRSAVSAADAPLPSPGDVKALAIHPAKVALIGSDSAAQLVVTATLNDGRVVDLTHDSKFAIADGKSAGVLVTGRVLPKANGTSEVVATYGDNIENYKGETVQILSGRKEARDDYTVLTKIERGSSDADLLVDYRLRLAPDGEWKVIDVIAEGISMVSNLRSQFQEVISQNGTDGLMKRLRDKTLPKANTSSASASGA